MMRLLTMLAQQAPEPGDFWSRLLGIDRVRLDKEAEVSLAWRHMPETWVLFLVVIPAVILLAWAIYRAERKDVALGAKLLLTALRAAVVILVLLMLMGPVLTVETQKLRNSYVLVLLDESRSMKKSDPPFTREAQLKVGHATGEADSDDQISPAEEAAIRKLTRADIVRRVLVNPRLRILEQLEEKHNVAYFTFSSGASARESREKLLDAYRSEDCIGTETAIGNAIKAAVGSLRGQIIAGVIVFSDGRNNSGIPTREIAQQLRQRYLPIYTVVPGVPQEAKNIALLELEANDAVLANDELAITFKTRAVGFEKEPGEVGLWILPIDKEIDKAVPTQPQELERLIAGARKEHTHTLKELPAATQKLQETFNYIPKTPGEYLIILKIEPRADESTAQDNYLVHRLRVADDKIKVLFVEHPPRWEYRYLKNSLIRDTKILTHCLLTSADEGFPQEHTRGADHPLFKQPLQEFPKELKALLEFDVVILGDVEPGRLGPDAAKNLELFVTEFGGGVVFVSGTLNNPRAFAGTPLMNLLPVIPDDSREPFDPDRVYTQDFGYLLTPDGKNHPITNFKEFKGDRDRNLEHWEDRDGRGDGQVRIRWFQRVKKLKAGAIALVEVAEASRPPLFATMHAGRGRAFWSGTDETWLWRKYVGDHPWFYPFWQQAMYWVRQGKLLGARRYRVTVDKDKYARGEEVRIYADAHDERFQKKTDPTIDVFVDPPAGERIKVTLHKDRDRDGWYEGVFEKISDTGSYAVWAGEEDVEARASARFSVFIPDREDDDPVLDVKTLQELARESNGGRFFPLEEVGALPDAVKKSQMVLHEMREDDLWDSPLAFLIFALLITAEWILRKVFRML
jgi:hypothetical protein